MWMGGSRTHGRALRRIGGVPVSVAWREAADQAKELEALCAWVTADHPREHSEDLVLAVGCHLQAAREAAEAAKPKQHLRMFRNGSLIERGMSNLDAAEALLLNFAPPDYVLGQMPCLLQHVRCHLVAADPRRQSFERVARELRVADPDHPRAHDDEKQHEGSDESPAIGNVAESQRDDDVEEIERTLECVRDRGAVPRRLVRACS